MLRRAYLIQPRPKPTWRDALLAPIVKSIALTLLFGSVVLDATKKRKDLEALESAYAARFKILHSVNARLRNKEPVDVVAELRIADAITRNRYTLVSDVELEEQVEDFFKFDSVDTRGTSVDTVMHEKTPKDVQTSLFL